LAVDPASRTSPKEILDRYSDGRMYIEQWENDDYLKAYENQSKFTHNASAHVHSVELYIWRQRIFFLECLKRFRELQREYHPDADYNSSSSTTTTTTTTTKTKLSTNITHVAFVDSDEFITVNPNALPAYNIHQNLPEVAENATVWDIIQHAKQRQAANASLAKLPLYQRLTGACLPMPRLLFGTKETLVGNNNNNNNNNNSTTFPSRDDFLTLRYQHHFGLQNIKKNRKIKSIIELSTSTATPFHLRLEYIHAHRPLKSKCKIEWEWLGALQGPLVAHHYVGRWDQWTFRDDPRSWTRKKINKYSSLSGNNNNNNNNDNTTTTKLYRETVATTWLDDFVRRRGVDTAKQLLKDVGYVPPRNTTIVNDSIPQ
jgi:hypothetical protein